MKIQLILASILLIASLAIIPVFSSAYAESESFIVAARSYDDFPVFMNSGDQISFAISVRGGSDDDIFLTLYSPTGSKLIDGVVYDQFSDNFSAMNSGTYTFRFDNTGSTISNKAVNFSHVVKINTYYVYVDPLPDWAIYPGSTVYDSTKAWKDANPNLNFYQADYPENANLRIQWVKEFGVQHVGYAYGSQFIEVSLGDSNCTGDWQPFSTDHVNWIMKHEIGHVLGLDHSSDPASIMYPTAPSAQYGMIEEQFTLTEGYTQFVPFCYSKSITDFSYSVSTDDPTYGFDVYVIPSVNEFHKSIDGNSFRHYSSSECFGEGYLKYSGTCRGLSQGSGLLVALDIRQSNGLTKLTVQQQESSISSTSLQPTTSTTISYDYPEVYEEDSQSLDDIFSELEKEQISFENKKTTPIVEPDNSKQIIYPKLNVNLDETFEEIYNINKNTECGYGKTLVSGYCLYDQYADEIVKAKPKTTAPEPPTVVTKTKVYSDKQYYIVNDVITLTGQTPSKVSSVKVRIDDPYGNLVKLIQIPNDGLNDFSASIKIEKLWFTTSGEYTINAWTSRAEPDKDSLTVIIAIPGSEYVKKKIVPTWIKNDAELWSAGVVNDSLFASGIEHMIKEEIIQIDITDAEKMSLSIDKIPNWVKNNIDWWSEGELTDEDLIKSIEYLIKEGIIKV